MSDDPNDNGTDGVTLAYVVGGIPAMVIFFIVLFILSNLIDIPA